MDFGPATGSANQQIETTFNPQGTGSRLISSIKASWSVPPSARAMRRDLRAAFPFEALSK
jgi:hypothetical protein